MFQPDDIIVSRASYRKDSQRAMRSVVVKVYGDGRFLRYNPRYNTKHIVDRPELWVKVGERGGGDKPGELAANARAALRAGEAPENGERREICKLIRNRTP